MPGREDREFIREKIVDKAATPRHRIMKFIKLLLTAIMFGLVASLFFVLGQKYLEPRFLPEETIPSETINIGRDELDHVEIDPEDSLEEVPEDPSQEEHSNAPDNGTVESAEGESNQSEGLEDTEETTQDEEALLQQQIQEAAEAAAKDVLKQQEEYLALGWYRQISGLISQTKQGLVTINSVTQETDWFNNAISNADQSAGAIIYMTDAEVLVLADYDSIREAESLTVTFYTGKTLEARIKKADSITGIAIVSVSKGAISDTLLRNIKTLPLGNSYQLGAGTPVMAAGCPVGYTGSVTTGILSLTQSGIVGTDTAFQLLYPDLQVAEEGTGFLFNMDGEIIGMLSHRYEDPSTGLATAIGISSLKGIMENLSSGIDVAYLGIQGQNVTTEIAAAYGMPTGIYVTKVIMDSPAYAAGIKAGDVICMAEQTEMPTMYKLQSFLENYSTGDVIRLQVARGGQDQYVEMEFQVTLGAR